MLIVKWLKDKEAKREQAYRKWNRKIWRKCAERREIGVCNLEVELCNKSPFPRYPHCTFDDCQKRKG